jgi:outer membrane protein assembly factor BamB
MAFSRLGVFLRAAILATLVPAFPQDWSEFRGPHRSGVSAATGVPVHFDTRTNVAWTAEIPMGRSSPIVNGNRLFLTAADEDNRFLLAFDTRTGKRLWRYSVRRSRRNEIDEIRNDPASPTPATDGEAVYAFFQDFGLLASTVHGRVLWTLPLGPFLNNYGIGSSPIVYGETVFLQCDLVRGSFMLAVNKRTGKIRWRKDRPSVIEGWSTPVILAKRGELVALSSSGLESLDVETGDTRWSIPASNGLMIPSPVTDGNRLVATIRGSDQPTFPTWQETLKDLDANKDGKLSPDEVEKEYGPNNFGIADSDRDGYITEEEWNRFRNRGVGEFGITTIRLSDKKVLWRYKRGLPYVPSPLLYQGVLYSVRTGGIITALDSDTGQLLKEGRSPDAIGEYFASPVAADGKIYFASADGKVSVITATPKWEFLAVNDLGESISASPAIADGAIFVRTHSRLYCFRKP